MREDCTAPAFQEAPDFHGIKELAHEKGAASIHAQVINEDLGKVLSRLPGVKFEAGPYADQPHRGHYQIPVAAMKSLELPEFVAKFDEDEPRDDRGRWTESAAAGAAKYESRLKDVTGSFTMSPGGRVWSTGQSEEHQKLFQALGFGDDGYEKAMKAGFVRGDVLEGPDGPYLSLEYLADSEQARENAARAVQAHPHALEVSIDRVRANERGELGGLLDGPKRFTGTGAAGRALRFLKGVTKEYDPDEPRDQLGRWTAEGMGAEARDAVANTPGARAHAGGIDLDVSRYQNAEQAGERSGRTGVCFLPGLKSPYGKYYHGKGAAEGYGGDQRVEGRVTLRNPLVVKAGTGGKAPEKAYDLLKGKGAYAAMRADMFKTAVPSGYNRLSGDREKQLQGVRDFRGRELGRAEREDRQGVRPQRGPPHRRARTTSPDERRRRGRADTTSWTRRAPATR